MAYDILTITNDLAESADRASKSVDTLGITLEQTDEVIRRASKSAQGYVNALDPVTKTENRLENAQKNLVRAQEALSDALKSGAVDQAAAERSIAAQREKVEKLSIAHQNAVLSTKSLSEAQSVVTSTTKLTGMQMAILGAQVHKLVDITLSGGSFLKGLVFELPNMAYEVGGVTNAIGLLKTFLSGPGGLVAGGLAVTAVLGGMALHAERVEEEMASLGQKLRSTRADYQDFARLSETSLKSLNKLHLSKKDSNAVISEIGSLPTINASDLSNYALEAKNLSVLMGSSVSDAAKVMADAYRDPAKAAEDFAQKGLYGVHEGLVQNIRDMESSGDVLGAWKTLMEQLGKTSVNAAEQSKTAWQKAVEEIGSSLQMRFLGNAINASSKFILRGFTSILKHGQSGELLSQIEQKRNSAQAVTNSTDNSAIPHLIDEIGIKLKANDDIIRLAHSIVQLESSTRQTDKNGRIIQAPGSDALGAFQVRPMNAHGNDLTTITGNVTAGLQELMRLYKQYGGDLRLVSTAYNWGSGRLNTALKTGGAIPKTVQDYAQKATRGRDYGAVKTAELELQARGGGLTSSNNSTESKIRSEKQALTALASQQKALDDLYQHGAISQNEYADRTQDVTEKLTQHKAALLGLRTPLEALSYQQTQQLQQATALSGAEQKMVETYQTVEAAAQKMGKTHASTNEILAAQAKQQDILTAQFKNSVSVIEAQTAANQNLLAGYDAAQGPLSNYLLKTQAIDKVRATAIPGTAEYAQQVETLTKALSAQKSVQSEINLASQSYGKSLDLDYIQQETALLGTNLDKRTIYLATLKEQQSLQKQGIDLSSKTAQTDLAQTAAIAAATAEYERQSRALSDLTSSISGVADSFTNALTNAVTQGSISVKNALSGLQVQFAGFFTKNSLTNPLLNLIDGGNRNTLLSMSSSLSSRVNRSADAFDGAGITAEALTTSGSRSAASARENSSIFGGKSGFLSGHLFNGISFGNLIGGVGGGLGLGSLTALIGGSQQGGLIGSGVGSLLGAGIGSLFGPVGPIVGGLIGGGAGGLFGGLFAKKKHVWDEIWGKNGQLVIGNIDTKRHGDNVTASLAPQLSSVNAALWDAGLQVDDGYYQDVGWKKKGKKKKVVNLQDLLGGVGLHSDDELQQRAINALMPKSFDSVSSYIQNVQAIHSLVKSLEDMHVAVKSFDDQTHVTVDHVTGYTGDLDKALNNVLSGNKWNTNDLQSKYQEITSFVNDTMKSLLGVTSDGTQSLVDQIADTQKKYSDAAKQAEKYGLDGTQFINKGNAITAALEQNEKTKLAQSDLSVQARYLTATGDDKNAALVNFDVSAEQQKKQLSDQWRAYLGDGFTTSSDYLRQQADLEKTLGAERLQIQREYNDKITSSLDGLKSALFDANSSISGSDWEELKKSSNPESLLGGVGLHSDDEVQQRAINALMPKSFDSVSSYIQNVQAIHSLVKSLEDMHIAVKSFDDQTHVTVDHVTGYTGDLDKALNNVLSGNKWNTNDLQSKYQEITSFVNDTMKNLLGVTSDGTQSLVDQIADTQKKYSDAAKQAEKYGLDGTQFINKGNAITAALEQNEKTKLSQSDLSVQARYLTATGDDKNAALVNFDISAEQQKKQLSDQWRAYLGDGFATSSDYLKQQADLEKTLGAERLQIQREYEGRSIAQEKQYRTQANQSLGGVFDNLTNWIKTLYSSNVSPLSVQKQYNQAKTTLDTDYRAAQGGDYEALEKLQSDGQTLLELGQKFLGSGTDYVRLYQDVIEKIGSISKSDTDKITRSLMEKLAQQQVDATNGGAELMKKSLEKLQQAVEKLAAQQKSANLALVLK